MRCEARGQDFPVFLIEDAIAKNQFGHLRPFHRGLDDDGIAKGGRKLELAV
jgi:hypothetical protein